MFSYTSDVLMKSSLDIIENIDCLEMIGEEKSFYKSQTCALGVGRKVRVFFNEK